MGHVVTYFLISHCEVLMITYYPKIETLFHRHSDTFKVIESQFKDEVYDNTLALNEFSDGV